MRRKAALFMAALMAGSSLTGSYVSAASIEGMPAENEQTENEQTEEISQEDEIVESSEIVEDLSVSEEEWQEDLLIEPELETENISVPEAGVEDDIILEEEQYQEEENALTEENVQTEEIPQENETVGSSEAVEDLPISEEEWQEDQLIETESEPETVSESEAEQEENSILEEEQDQEAEQLIEGEPVELMEETESETSNADQETLDAEPEEAEEVKLEYNYDALPGDDALLPGWSYDIRPVSAVGVREAGSEDDWDWRSVDITEVRILNDENGILQYTPLEEGPDLVARNESGHYYMEIRRDADGGEARIQITCEEQDKDREDPVHVVKEFTIWAVEGRYDADYSYISGDNTMLPGSEMEISTSLYHSWYDPAEDQHKGNPVEDYTIELRYNEENVPAWDADLISVELEEDQRTIRVTAGNNSGGTDIPIRYMVADENGDQTEVGQQTIHVEVAEDFYTIEPVSLNEAVRNCNVGDVVDFNDFQITTQHWVKDGEDIQTMALVDQDQSEIRYYTEYDEEAWERLDDPEDRYGLPVLKRITCGNTNVGIFAEKKFVSEDNAENWQTVAGRSYNFEEKQYNVELSFTGSDRLYYGERGTGSLTVAADTEGLGNLEDYRMNWEVTQYQGDQPEEVSCATMNVSEDGTKCTVTAREDLDSGEYFNLHIHVTVTKDDMEVAATDIDIPVMPTELELGGLPQDTVLLPDWEYTVDREYQIWRKDARHPDGENVPVQITGVRVRQNENDVLSYDSSEEDSQTVIADDEGYYHLHAFRDANEMRSGEAVIEFDYAEAGLQEDPENAEMYVSGTEEFRIWVATEKYSTGYEYVNGESLLLPGSNMMITTSLYRDWYDENEDCHGGQEIKDYTIELQQYNEDGTPSWDMNLIDVKTDEENNIHVTAKDAEEGETDIPVRYLIGENKVGMEWIHIAVYRQFCIIEPGYLTEENGERINPHIGDILNLADAGIQTYNYSVEKGEKEVVENVRYRVEYDDNAWEVVDPGQIVDGYGLPELRRTGNWGTEVTVIAENTENSEEIARHSYWFDEKNYDFRFEEGDAVLFYGDRSTPLTITADISGLEAAGLTDYSVVFEVEQHRNGEREDLNCATYTTTDDSCILDPKNDFTSEDDISLHIRAVVQKNRIELASVDMDISVMSTEANIDSLPQDDVLLPDWEYTVDREYQIWRKDARYPEGENVPVQITGVRVLQNENDVLSYDSSEADPQTVTADENGYYHLHAIRDNTQIHGGEAVIEFDYMEPEGLKNPKNAGMYVSGTKTFRIWVDAQKYNTGYEYENGNSLLLPCSDMTITTSLSEEWYDIDEDCHGGQEIEDYTIELQQYNEDGTPSWDRNLIDVETDEENNIHVTAKDAEEGETDIPVRYLIGENEVGMEWIHIAVYRQFCIIEPGYLTGEDGVRLNPYIGDILNLATAGIQTYNYSAENEEKEEKEAVEDVRYRVEYDGNAWKVVDPDQIVDSYGLPELQRTGNWGTDVTVVAERTENGEEIARQSYWFDGYDYFSEYVYSMNEERLNYGHFYTDEVPLQATLSVEPGLPEDAVVEWNTVIYDEAGNESQPDWVTLVQDAEDPCKVQVTLSESADIEQHIDDGFNLRAVVKIGDNELTRIDEWVNLQNVQFDFQIPYLLYLTGNEPDPMEFRNTDWWALEQQNGTCPNGKAEFVKVVKVSELCEEGQGLLSITDIEDGISVTPLDDEQPGETTVRIWLEYKDGTSAGTVDIPAYIQESITGLDEVQFDSDGTETQLLPGQTMGITTVVRNYRRNGKILESTNLKEGEDYTVEFCDYNTDIVEYQEDGRFHAKGRGNTWITMRIRDMEGNEITAYNFEIQVTGSYFKAEQRDSEELMLTAGGSEVEIPYTLRRHAISNPEGYDVEPVNVVLDRIGDTPGLNIAYEDGKIMAALDKDAELEAGEMRETCMQLAFLDEEENVLTESGFTVMLHKHDMQTVVDKKATCGAAGSQHKECSVCHTKEKATAIPATGKHKMQTKVDKAATCGAAGSQHKECSVCHTKEKATAIPATGKHSFSGYVVTREATALAAGTKTRTCKVCGTKESRSIAKLTPTIKLAATKVTVAVGDSVEVGKYVTGLAKGDSVASYTSSNKKVAVVSKTGKVTGRAVGTTKITVKLASGKTATITVAVQKKIIETKSIKNLSKTMKMKVKGTAQLKPVISPSNTTDKLIYTSSDKAVVTVSAKGKLTAKKVGKAKITVQSGKKKFTITVTVEAPTPTGIKDVPTTKTLAKGKTLVLKPTLVPAGAQAKISYTTSNKKVATVDAKGKVTAKGKGKAVITITAGKVKKTCTVTVK